MYDWMHEQMKFEQGINPTLSFAQPRQPKFNDWAFRLLTYGEHSADTGQIFPMFELSRAKYELVEGGDAENGPSVWLSLGNWEVIAAGMGYNSPFEQMIEEYHCDCGSPICQICHPDPNIGM